MVGDTRGDMKGGHNAEVKSIAVTWGYQLREVLQIEQPDYFIDSPELVEILK